MNVIKTSFALAAIAVLGILFAAAANATPVNYDFTVTATSGPLDGTVSHGTFSFDSSSVTPGTWNRATGLLTAFDFTWNGTTYNAATANTGTLSFDGAGHLTDFMFGTHCSAGECSFAIAPETWFAWSDAFFYSLPTGASGGGSVTFSPAATSVPEPAALGLFGFGALLIGAFVSLRRRMA